LKVKQFAATGGTSGGLRTFCVRLFGFTDSNAASGSYPQQEDGDGQKRMARRASEIGFARGRTRDVTFEQVAREPN